MDNPQTLEVPGYQVLKYLGTGARSSIWQIRDLQTQHVYALKRVVRQHASDQRFLEQAINEYEVGHSLRHPGLRRIHYLRRVKKWFVVREIHLVMEYCPGVTIQEWRPEDLGQVVEIFLQTASVLSYMHDAGIIHADMKPNNIVVGPKGRVKIIDLGQSCPVGTVKERIQGTPDFIAPEQVQRRGLDARTDVFNLGATLYWTLAGTPIPTVLPKDKGLRTPDYLQARPVEQINTQVPPPLAKLVSDCIEHQPRRRVQTMAEVEGRLNVIAHFMGLPGLEDTDRYPRRFETDPSAGEFDLMEHIDEEIRASGGPDPAETDHGIQLPDVEEDDDARKES